MKKTMRDEKREIDLDTVEWKPDRITQKYVRCRPYLRYISELDPKDLAEASTYCISVINPFSAELCRRAGTLTRYQAAMHGTVAEAYLAVKDAASIFGIIYI